MEVDRLAGAHELADVLEVVPLQELEEHLVSEGPGGIGQHPFAGDRRSVYAASRRRYPQPVNAFPTASRGPWLAPTTGRDHPP